MPPVGFEPKVSAGERPKTYALDRAATGTGHWDRPLGPATGTGHWDRHTAPITVQ